jgi:hypothetical protein
MRGPSRPLTRNSRTFIPQHVAFDPLLHPTPVVFTKTRDAPDNGTVDARRSQTMKPVAERTSAGDPEARFQRGSHGKRSELGDDVFFSTDGQQLFIEEVLVSSEASQGGTSFCANVSSVRRGKRGVWRQRLRRGRCWRRLRKQACA